MENKYPVKISGTQNFKNKQLLKPENILFASYIIAYWLELGMRVQVLGELRLEFILALILSIIALLKFFNQRNLYPLNSSVVKAAILYLSILFISLPI